MRIVAGRFKGRRLSGPKGAAARPTSDKVREALFSILGDVSGLRVLDLFAGTGALGLEALSRGAERVVFVERDRRMLTVLRSNIETVAGAAASPAQAEAASGDALDYLRRTSGRESFDLVLLDPPYAEAERLAEPLRELLVPLLEPGALVVVECDRRSPLMLEDAGGAGLQEGLTLQSERRYGDTLLRILQAPIDP